MASSIERERSPIAVLLDPKKDIPLGERDIRLDDYLNDKLQTVSDFGSLATLIASVEDQKRLLEEQVSKLRWLVSFG
jgi:RAD50-interacting protein 1